MKRFSFRKVAGIIIVTCAGILVVSAIVRVLWNSIMPDLFHLPVISFWQAAGLLLLTKILFGSFRGPGPRGAWKDKMKQRWMNMTPEERERFRQDWGKQDWGKRCRRPFEQEGRSFNRGFSNPQDAPSPEKNSTTGNYAPQDTPLSEKRPFQGGPTSEGRDSAGNPAPTGNPS